MNHYSEEVARRLHRKRERLLRAQKRESEGLRQRHEAKATAEAQRKMRAQREMRELRQAKRLAESAQ